jgi:hypothetical protein
MEAFVAGCPDIVSGQRSLHDYGSDIYTEAHGDSDTLTELGPLRPLAGIWTSADGADVHPVGPGSDIVGPVADGQEHNAFVERYELQPIDRQKKWTAVLTCLARNNVCSM